jgi:hypothetical protein
MVIYKRNIENKLMALRIVSLLLGFLCYYSFDSFNTNLGYFLSVILVLLSIVVIENFKVFPNSFQVKRFYFFGFFPVKWNFMKDEFDIRSYGSNYGEEGDALELGQAETGAGCLFYLFTIFSSKGRITHRKFILRKKGSGLFSLNRVDILLSNEEYELLKGF